MKILFTGAGSFTGYWIVKELAEAGHEVTMIFREKVGDHEGLVGKRDELVSKFGAYKEEVTFGDEKFLALIKESKWDLLCHHAADTRNYKSPDFDVETAVENNTHNLSEITDALKEQGCEHIVLTGSFFEQDEGEGKTPEDMRDFSAYGKSKRLTWEHFEKMGKEKGVKVGKFVIPNPFGPYENMGFTSYLAKTWFAGETPRVKTPDYVRDNLHVSLMAKAYAQFAEKFVGGGPTKINPSGYISKQGDFGKLFAKEMEPRLGIPCPMEFADQVEFPEPRNRINTDKLDAGELNWDESKAWDELADFYKSQYGQQ
jgi:UDP-glucose 4-epimerase